MMPDLGQYAVPVLAAYGGALAMLAALLIASVVQSLRVQKRLAEVEARRKP